MKEYRIVDDWTLERIFKEFIKKKKSRVEDIIEDIQYVDLVYPPESTPPIRDSVRKRSIIGFCKISQG